MGASTSPNIVSVSSIYGTTIGFALSTTVTTDLITVSANKILRLTAIRAINPLLLAKTINVPAGSALDLVEKGQIYLRAGDVLEGGASAAGDIQLAVSYEVLDDA